MSSDSELSNSELSNSGLAGKHYFVYWYGKDPGVNTFVDNLVAANPTRFTKLPISWDRFPDGTANINIDGLEKLQGRRVLFVASFPREGEKMRQLYVLSHIARQGIKSLTLVLPYFPTGTMERIEYDGEVATAPIDSELLDLMVGKHCETFLYVYDIHALQNRHYFRKVKTRLTTAMPVLKDYIPKIFEMELLENRFAIAFPDDGASKRFSKYFPKHNIIVCSKVRDGDKRYVRIKEGNPKGLTILIVDDLVQSGGTLIECKNALIKAGAASVSCFVTHVVFPNGSWKRFMPGDGGDGFESFYFTNSRPTKALELDGKGPFKMLGLENHLESILL